jgi:hypothetical protein
MKRSAVALIWVSVLIVGAVLAVWAFPRVFPMYPDEWKVARADAVAIARGRLAALGDLPQDAYVVASLDDDAPVELRLLGGLTPENRERVRRSGPAKDVLCWQVAIYPPGAHPGEWSYLARVALDGEVLALRKGFKKDAPGEAIDEADARARAEEFLKAQGFDLARYEAPELRRQDLGARTDLVLRFREREQVLGDQLQYGVQVTFAGKELAGFANWQEDKNRAAVEGSIQSLTLLANFHFVMVFLIVPVVAVPFLKRYHAGEIGVHRGLQIFAFVVVVAIFLLSMVARSQTEGTYWGSLSRQQVTWMWGPQFFMIFFVPIGLASLLAWSVGESLNRERWGRKLAAFDALFQRDWRNRTVASSSLRGLAIGVALTAAVLVGQLLSPAAGHATWSMQLGPFWQHSSWPGLTLLGFVGIFVLYSELVGRLCLVEPLVRRLGRIGGTLAAALLGFFTYSFALIVLPLRSSFPFWIGSCLVLVIVFLRYDLLTSMLANATHQVVMMGLPLLLAKHPGIEFQGALALAGVALPAVLSLRYLTSDREFVYRYEDVPPHVRRIAERERQRVELETARNIQSSILPDLPPQLAGVELAHTYRPATEVGGDFYDVLALEDGRLAVAVGDVAGHGVSSGLVMSMAKSALAVQVTFDPEVQAVFTTLNRMVYQSARKRLLATLCYALVDPKRREMDFASAGHLFPYRVSGEGRVEVLESVAYPLGVRPTIEVVARRARLAAGDLIFLCSDGLIEARKNGTEEPFGFDRLEKLLSGLAGRGAIFVRDAVLAELDRFVGANAEREDDLTLLVLRMP